MDKITQINSIDDYCQLLGTKPLHPLVNVTDFSELPRIFHGRKIFEFYCVYYNEMDYGTVRYGRGEYGYREGTMLFVAPEQIVGVDDYGLSENSRGIVLMFHPDFIMGSTLGKRIKDLSGLGELEKGTWYITVILIYLAENNLYHIYCSRLCID